MSTVTAGGCDTCNTVEPTIRDPLREGRPLYKGHLLWHHAVYYFNSEIGTSSLQNYWPQSVPCSKVPLYYCLSLHVCIVCCQFLSYTSHLSQLLFSFEKRVVLGAVVHLLCLNLVDKCTVLCHWPKNIGNSTAIHLPRGGHKLPCAPD